MTARVAPGAPLTVAGVILDSCGDPFLTARSDRIENSSVVFKLVP